MVEFRVKIERIKADYYTLGAPRSVKSLLSAPMHAPAYTTAPGPTLSTNLRIGQLTAPMHAPHISTHQKVSAHSDYYPCTYRTHANLRTKSNDLAHFSHPCTHRHLQRYPCIFWFPSRIRTIFRTQTPLYTRVPQNTFRTLTRTHAPVHALEQIQSQMHFEHSMTH